jgi:hypothetical protein
MKIAKASVADIEMAFELVGARKAIPLSDWHEDIGAALWWRFPVEEPPYCGSPTYEDWPGYHTHWTPILVPHEPAVAVVDDAP